MAPCMSEVSTFVFFVENFLKDEFVYSDFGDYQLRIEGKD
jgi:hypothetical protein